MNKGFTLIELLVVVLIIGILAAVALPQYQKAVRKARITEVLTNVSTIKKAVDVFLLGRGGFLSSQVNLKDILSEAGMELKLDEYDELKDFQYGGGCNTQQECEIVISDVMYGYVLFELYRNETGWYPDCCYTNTTPEGQAICKSLEPLGWEYVDDYF